MKQSEIDQALHIGDYEIVHVSLETGEVLTEDQIQKMHEDLHAQGKCEKFAICLPQINSTGQLVDPYTFEAFDLDTYNSSWENSKIN